MTTMNSSQRKFLTLEEVERSEIGPVWVLNTSDQIGESANILMSVPKVNGNGSDLVRIPKSFIPFDLAMQVPRVQLMNSSEFRKTIQKRLLRICNPLYAEALLRTESGREEHARIENLMRASMLATENANVVATEDEDEYFDPSAMDGSKTKMQKAVAKDEEEKASRKEEPEVSIKLQTLVNNAKNEEWTATRVVNALRNHAKFNRAEVKYLAAKFKEQAAVKKFIVTLKESLERKSKAKA